MSINIQGGFGLGMSHLMLNVENIISRIKKICCVSVSKAMSCKRAEYRRGSIYCVDNVEVITTFNLADGAGTNYPVCGSIAKGGAYTIVAEKTGTGAKKWGKLKSGAGWIALDYTAKIK